MDHASPNSTGSLTNWGVSLLSQLHNFKFGKSAIYCRFVKLRGDSSTGHLEESIQGDGVELKQRKITDWLKNDP
ncbi:unnamed protein product [Blepharisma stoltei]|uniref:Uncharacterized protein n=1 Tax=Blepharisma stoltei TaxID=1481888 RepID=A0AAU9JKQ9_9CILI|nr:unnamed protein product [Blepharisma stoltei]